MRELNKNLDREITRLIKELEQTDPTDDSYEIIGKNLKQLTEAKNTVAKSGLDSNVILSCVTNIVGILIVLEFEQTRVIVGKGFNMIRKIIH